VVVTIAIAISIADIATMTIDTVIADVAIPARVGAYL
jgi:hypothetical protein